MWEGHRGEHERAADQGSESPGFKMSSSLLDPGQRSPPESSLQASQGGSGDVSPPMSDPDPEQGMWMQTAIPGVTQELAPSLPHVSRGSSLDPLSQERVSDLEGSAAAAASYASMQSEEKEEEKPGWGGKEDPGRLQDPAVAPGAAQGDGTVPDGHRDDMHGGGPPGKRQRGEGEGPSLEGGGSSPSEGVLSSCTVVEGLMFPLEYYVRMTRRLSRRQEEVNLEAVIQSQLGKGRKGWKQAPSLAQSSQELPKSDDRLSSTPSVRGEASGCPPVSRESAGSSRGRGRRRLRRKTQQRTSSSTGQLENLEGLIPPLPPERLFLLQKDFIGGEGKAAALPLGSKRRGLEGLEGPVAGRGGV